MTVEETVADRLDTVVRLLAVLATRDIEQQKDKIITLSSAGMQPKEIAAFLDTTSNTVNVALSSMRKAKKSGARKSRKK